VTTYGSDDAILTLQAKLQATIGHKSGKLGQGTQRRDGGAAATQDDAANREARIQQAMSQTLPKGSSGEDVLGSVVGQLAKCRVDELARLKSWTGLKKQLAVYRSALKRCGTPPESRTQVGLWESKFGTSTKR